MTYYDEQFAGSAHGLARNEDIVASLQAIETGFGKLPTEEQLKTDSTTSAIATGGPTNYNVTLPYSGFLTAYIDQMRIGVRFPNANDGPANLNVMGQSGALGSIALRQINGDPLTASHWAAGSDVLLQFNGNATPRHWTVMAGARGERGPPSAPDGTFSINVNRELIFTPAGGTPSNNLGPIAPLWQGAYDAAETYRFLQLARGTDGVIYIHVGQADTTGTALTDTAVWQPFVESTASETVKGLVLLATTSDATAGANDTKAMTPQTTRAAIDNRVPAASATAAGKVELATNAETRTGTDTARAVTPAGVDDKFVGMTRSAYDALSTAVKNDGRWYFTRRG